MNQAYAMGVRVPRTYLLVEDSRAAKTAYLIMERITGKTLGETLQERAGSSGVEDLLQAFMRSLAGIHALDWQEGFGFLNRQDIANHPDLFYEHEFKYVKMRVNDHGITELKQVIDWLDENRIAIDNLCLLHSDYHPMNILVTPTDEFVIIDWSNTKIGDYRYDLAFAVMGLKSMGFNTDHLVPIYESYAKKKVENLEYFAVLASLWNLLRIYSAVFDHSITGENEETERIFATEYNFYAQEVVRVTQETTGVDLAELLKALGG